MPAPDADGLIGLLQQVGGWDGFEVASVTTDETPAPDVHGVPAPRLVIALRPAADHVLDANRALFTVHVLKDDFKQLWQYRAVHAARRWWQHWRRRARASRLVPLQRFVATLERHMHGILAHCRYPLSTGILEGCNNEVKVLKRMAYGYRDDAYLFLKIRAAFPGNAR